MSELRCEPVVFETQELFDLDITLQSAGYEVNNAYTKGEARVKSYNNPVTKAYLVISEVVHENKLAV